MRNEQLSLHLEPRYLTIGADESWHDSLRISFVFAVIDVTDCNDDLGFLAGFLQGARIPFVLLCRESTEAAIQRIEFGGTKPIRYESTDDLFQPRAALHRELLQAIPQARVIDELVHKLWFPRDTTTIWVVCPKIHEPGEFADRSSSDYTYLDNLGDTDALIEVMVFLSRHYPKAIIDKFNSGDLPRGHANNNLVVIGGPGSSDEIENQLCREMMRSVGSRVSYSEDCEKMYVALDNGTPVEFEAELRPGKRPEDYSVRRDRGYFARFFNPLNENATVILVNGIHTLGVLGAALAFADRKESSRNYGSLFESSAKPESFECHFEVAVLNGMVAVPRIAPENIHSLGVTRRRLPEALSAEESGNDVACNRDSVTIVFIAGDRGGSTHNQLQTTKELDAIRDGLRSSEHREVFNLTHPILGATHQKLVEAYRNQPAILHFAGHGDDRSLSLILDQGLLASPIPLDANRLGEILRNFPTRVRFCVLNACASAAIAQSLAEAGIVDAALGWPSRVPDATAIKFSEILYGCIGEGLALSKAVALAAHGSNAETPPLLFKADGINLDEYSFIERTKNEQRG